MIGNADKGELKKLVHSGADRSGLTCKRDYNETSFEERVLWCIDERDFLSLGKRPRSSRMNSAAAHQREACLFFFFFGNSWASLYFGNSILGLCLL